MWNQSRIGGFVAPDIGQGRPQTGTSVGECRYFSVIGSANGSSSGFLPDLGYVGLTRSSWGWFQFTRWDVATFIGTLGLFTFLFFCFVRVLPMISMNEVRTLIPASKVRKGAHVE